MSYTHTCAQTWWQPTRGDMSGLIPGSEPHIVIVNEGCNWNFPGVLIFQVSVGCFMWLKLSNWACPPVWLCGRDYELAAAGHPSFFTLSSHNSAKTRLFPSRWISLSDVLLHFCLWSDHSTVKTDPCSYFLIIPDWYLMPEYTNKLSRIEGVFFHDLMFMKLPQLFCFY